MNQMRRLNAWVLGGDERYPWTVRTLRENGLPVKTWGVPDMTDDAPGLEAALEGANLVLLPMAPFQGERIKIGRDSVEAALLPWLLEKDAMLLYGRIDPAMENWLQNQGVRCVSVLDLPAFRMTNAMITAEGAVGVAIKELDRTLAGASVLVVGWGRIGKFLAAKLRALGAEVTVSARRESDWAEIEALGFRAEETGAFRHGLEYDLICNTVPARVFPEKTGGIGADCVCIELASVPGGFPPEGGSIRRLIMARGLPGITAPRSAGEALAEAVLTCMSEEGRPME